MNANGFCPACQKPFVLAVAVVLGQAFAAAAATASFGPAHTAILKSPHGRSAELLDLDTGRRAVNGAFGENDRATHAWIRSNRLDVLGAIEHGRFAVLCMDMAVMPGPSNGWQTVSASAIVTNRLLDQMEPNKITAISPWEDHTDTWLFRTRENSLGLLQTLGTNEHPEGVKIRYKLVQTSGRTSELDRSPTPDRKRAVACFNEIENSAHEFEAAFNATNLPAAQASVRRLLEAIPDFNAAVCGTGSEFAPALYDELGKVKQALDAGDWGEARRLGAYSERFAADFRRICLDIRQWARHLPEWSQAEYPTLLSPAGTLAIVRHPVPLQFHRPALKALPTYDPAKAGTFQIDLRSRDLSGFDLGNRVPDLLHADFDSKTVWPFALPAGFDRARIMALGKDPGLRVRQLHAKGITGKGVGIGIIDQTLLVEHAEYGPRLRLYEELHSPSSAASMHGPAVASIAAGKSTGVAPEADLYYLAETHGVFSGEHNFDWDFTYLAQAVDRLLEVNATLANPAKIRVISVSVGWMSGQKGYAEISGALKRAREAGVFVISTALEATHGFSFNGLGRSPLADPNKFTSFGPGAFWAKWFYEPGRRFMPGERLLVPMDARCVASPTGAEDFVFYAGGGESWSVPWIAGLYALACQVKPDITPEQFWDEALKTGRTISLQKEEEQIQFGTIADPVALMENLQK